MGGSAETDNCVNVRHGESVNLASMTSVVLSSISSRQLSLSAIMSLAVQNKVSTERLVVIPPCLPLGGPRSGVVRLARVNFIVNTPLRH